MTEVAEGKNEYFVDAVHRAMELVMLVSQEPGLGVSELSRRSGIGKARAYRLLRTLEESGIVTRSKDGGLFTLGYSALLLGTAATQQIDLIRNAIPILRSVGESVNETVLVRIRDRDEVVTVAKWEPGRELRVNSILGRRRVIGSGSNKILLAFAQEDDRRETLDRIYAKNNAFVPRNELEATLDNIRQDGYCVSYGEAVDLLVGISAPVFSHTGAIVAAINMVAPAVRINEGNLELFIEEVKRGAGILSRELGHVDKVN